MNTEEVRNAILVLEKALKEGLLDTPDNIEKMNKLDGLIKHKQKKSHKLSTKDIFSESSDTNKITSSSKQLSNKISSSSHKVLSSSHKHISSSSKNSSTGNTESELDKMTNNPVPSEYFVQSDRNSESNGLSDSNYNLAMSYTNILSGCSKDSDEIIDLSVFNKHTR